MEKFFYKINNSSEIKTVHIKNKKMAIASLMKWYDIFNKSEIEFITQIKDVYEECKKQNIEINSWCSDLYIPVNRRTKTIIELYEFKMNVTIFNSDIDGRLFYDIPFAYTPYNDKRLKGN